MAADQRERPRLVPALAFWAVAVALTTISLGSGGLHGSEDRFAEIARWMVRTRDFLHPTLNGESHFHKPLLSYWAIVAASAIAGMNELAARVPSALAGLVALGATVSLGRRSWGDAVGRLAGWVLLGSYGFLLWSRTAAADMENLAAVILAVAWFRAGEERRGVAFYLVFAIVCAIGAQAKGLAAIVLPIVALAPHLLRWGRWREHLRGGALGAAVVVGLLVYLAPLVLADLGRTDAGGRGALWAGDPRSGLYMVFQENVQRFYAPRDHREPVTTYLIALPVLLLPWSLVFGAALIEGVRRRSRLDEDTSWLLWVIGLIFALFTASGSRRSYYVLPILPFCALLTAVVLVETRHGRLLRGAVDLTVKLLAGLSAAEIGAALLALPLSLLTGVPAFAGLVAITFALGLGGLWMWSQREAAMAGIARRLAVPPSVVLPALLSVSLFGGYFAGQFPLLDRYRTEKPFALSLGEAARELPPGRVAFLWHVPALFPFYMEVESPIPVLRTAEEVRDFAAKGPGLVVASPRSRSRVFRSGDDEFAGEVVLREERWPWEDGSERLSAWSIGDGGGLPASVLRAE